MQITCICNNHLVSKKTQVFEDKRFDYLSNGKYILIVILSKPSTWPRDMTYFSMPRVKRTGSSVTPL